MQGCWPRGSRLCLWPWYTLIARHASEDLLDCLLKPRGRWQVDGHPTPRCSPRAAGALAGIPVVPMACSCLQSCFSPYPSRYCLPPTVQPDPHLCLFPAPHPSQPSWLFSLERFCCSLAHRVSLFRVSCCVCLYSAMIMVQSAWRAGAFTTREAWVCPQLWVGLGDGS